MYKIGDNFGEYGAEKVVFATLNKVVTSFQGRYYLYILYDAEYYRIAEMIYGKETLEKYFKNDFEFAFSEKRKKRMKVINNNLKRLEEEKKKWEEEYVMYSEMG